MPADADNSPEMLPRRRNARGARYRVRFLFTDELARYNLLQGARSHAAVAIYRYQYLERRND